MEEIFLTAFVAFGFGLADFRTEVVATEATPFSIDDVNAL
jgi:hypothetical protein